jgi:hypothetical protein
MSCQPICTLLFTVLICTFSCYLLFSTPIGFIVKDKLSLAPLPLDHRFVCNEYNCLFVQLKQKCEKGHLCFLPDKDLQIANRLQLVNRQEKPAVYPFNSSIAV